MDDVQCILTCGYTTPFKDLKCKEDGIECWLCQSHNINIQECLKMHLNRLNLTRKEFEIEKISFERLIESYDACREDPDFFIQESLKDVKNELDLRREELKKQIDDCYFEFYKEIEREFESKKTKFNEDTKKIDDFKSELETFELPLNLKHKEEMDFLEASVKKLQENIKFIKTPIDELKRESFILGDQNADVKNLLGELVKEDHEDPDRSKATFQLVLENFSQFKEDCERRYSPVPCMVRNMPWKILAISRIDEGIHRLAFYISNDYKPKPSDYNVDATAELKLLHPNDSNKNFIKEIRKTFTVKIKNWGIPSFISMKELAENGYHDSFKDSITLEVSLSVD